MNNAIAASKTNARLLAQRIKKSTAYTEVLGKQINIIGAEDTTDMTQEQPTLYATVTGVFAIKSAATSSYQIGNFVMADAVTLPPIMQAQAAGNNFVLTWPVSGQNFNLQTTTNLADTNSWMTLTNVPSIVNLQNTITNPILGSQGFYRLIQSQ